MRIPIVNRFTCSPNQLNFFIKNLKNKNFIPILDYANENYQDYDRNIFEINKLIKKFPNNYIALKLSSLNIKNDVDFALKNADNMIIKAKEKNTKILIDAEDYLIQNEINNITDILLEKHNKDQVNIFKTYQLYRNDVLPILERDLLNKNFKLGCKLVRGAYLNQDSKYGILFNKT